MRSCIFTSIIFFILFIVMPTKAQNLSPVSLDCVNDPNSGPIEITWSVDNSDCTDFENYQILVTDNLLDTFKLVTEITDPNQTFYIDSSTPNVSNSFLFYTMIKNCDGKTSIPSDTLDSQRPLFPIIDYVTVVGDDVEIKWQESVSPEADAYIIHYFSDSGDSRIDTIGNNNLIYTHTNAEPGVKSERYTISTVDACMEAGGQNTLASKTIFLRAISTICSNDVFLDWTPYEGWLDGVSAYELYASYNGGPYSVFDTVPADNERYNFQNTRENINDLCFQIKALKGDESAESNSNAACVNLLASSGNQPEYIYIQNLTILDDGSVQLRYYIDNSVDIETIRYLSGTSADDLNLIETQLLPNNFPSANSFNDAVSDSRNRILTYQVQVEDSCGTRYGSKFARTIHLTGKPDGANTNYLNWTGFGIHHGTVSGYTVYRQELNGDFVEVGNTIGDMVRFDEDVQFVQPNADGEICYRVEANYDIDFPLLPSESLTSLSNTICITQPGRIIAPNAFAPNGVNNIFKPVTVNIDPANYQMIIMNRWGGVVYQSSNPEDGWDGNYKGRDAQEGVYAYYFSYSGFDGELREKKGTVLLLR